MERASAEALTALEISLHEPPRCVESGSFRLDLSQRFEHPESARSVAARLPASSAAESLRRWGNLGERDARDVPCLWLEFDLGHEDDAVAIPVPLVCLRASANLESTRLFDRIVPEIFGRSASAAQRRAIDRCLDSAPGAARPLYVFDLSPRRPGRLRLELIGLDAGNARPFLRSILPAETARRAEALLPWIADSDRPHFSFDIEADGSITDRVGFETSYVRLPHREPRWTRLFERLVDEGLCAPETRDALFAWPGQDRRARASDLWPRSMSLAEGHLARVLSHVKLVTAADRPIEAKGYFLFRFLPAARPSIGPV